MTSFISLLILIRTLPEGFRTIKMLTLGGPTKFCAIVFVSPKFSQEAPLNSAKFCPTDFRILRYSESLGIPIDGIPYLEWHSVFLDDKWKCLLEAGHYGRLTALYIYGTRHQDNKGEVETTNKRCPAAN